MTSKQGKRLNPFQHALQRPDTYIGSIKTVERDMWVYEEPETHENGEGAEGEENTEPVRKGVFAYKKINYNQGLTRIFVEIMSNGIDNKWRSEAHGLQMKKLDFSVETDPESEKYGWITVVNDGYCIPVEKSVYEYHEYRTNKVIKEELYPAEVFFGEMLAGTNFEEDNTRKTSGRNGLGAKAAIVFSKEAEVEHTNPDQQKKFKQTYYDNGTRRDPPEITTYKAKTGYTSFSFLPDYERFGYPGMDADFYSLIKGYVYEAAMITGLTVTLNGEKIVVKDMEKFARLFYPNAKDHKMISFKAPNGDECVLVERGVPDADIAEEVSHISWINGIKTRDGGVHVDPWVKSIFDKLVKTFNARKPKKGEKEALKASAKEIYPYFVLFVRAEAPGAQFDSQTKDRMTQPDIDLAPSKEEKTAFNGEINEAMKKLMKWNFVGLLEEKLSMKAERSQARKEGTKRKMAFGENVTEANRAGTKEGYKCTLFITEGASAKAFADRIISVIENGSDYFGSFAIKGKFINVQKTSQSVASANEEMKILKRILGLTTGQVYTDTSELRYGHVCLMTDQDDDGFHIKGLLLNVFYHYWPSLFKLVCEDGSPYFMLESFTTAVVIATWGKNMMKIFYSNPEFRSWYEKEGQHIKGLKVRYLKGLGSHSPGDELIYLEDQKKLLYTLDGEDSDWMTLGFADKQTDWRKEWITRDMTKPGEMSLVEEDSLPITVDGPISLSTFVDEQLIIYHKMALSRAIPNMYDGFKHAQRQVFYGITEDPDARKGSLQNVENLIGSVKKLTGYHHGGVSLEGTIVNMAQGFVGSNNIPLLVNGGEFGTRLKGGEDAAAARYISTKPEEIVETLYNKMDLPLLEKVVEDGKEREYKMYMPLMPTVLINGGAGIASGYSSSIPNYNPEDIANWEEAWIDSEDGVVNLPPLVPWYRGFTGEITLMEKEGTKYKPWDPETSTGKPIAWMSRGILEQGKGGWWHIKELPIGLWTNKMKIHLEYLETGVPPEKSKKKKGEKCLLDVNWKGTTNTVLWDIKPSKDFIPDMEVAGNFKNMVSIERLTNIHVLDENGYPRKYESPEDLLQDFCKTRLDYYERRRSYWLDEYNKEYEKESDRYKYVKAVVEKKLNMHQKADKLEKDMLAMGLRKIASGKENSEGEAKESFDYLLSMQMRSMTVEKLVEIKNTVDKTKSRYDELEAKTARDLWKEDLAAFRIAYAKFLKTRVEECAPTKKIKYK